MTTKQKLAIARAALEKCQDLFGEAKGCYQNDRQPDRAGALEPILEEGFIVALNAIGALDGFEPENKP